MYNSRRQSCAEIPVHWKIYGSHRDSCKFCALAHSNWTTSQGRNGFLLCVNIRKVERRKGVLGFYSDLVVWAFCSLKAMLSSEIRASHKTDIYQSVYRVISGAENARTKSPVLISLVWIGCLQKLPLSNLLFIAFLCSFDDVKYMFVLYRTLVRKLSLSLIMIRNFMDSQENSSQTVFCHTFIARVLHKL